MAFFMRVVTHSICQKARSRRSQPWQKERLTVSDVHRFLLSKTEVKFPSRMVVRVKKDAHHTLVKGYSRATVDDVAMFCSS